MKTQFELMRKLSGSNFKLVLTLRIFTNIFAVIIGCTCFFVYFLTVAYLGTEYSYYLFILALLAPAFPLAIINPTFAANLRRLNTVNKLNDIMIAVDSTPIMFLDNSCFYPLLEVEKIEIIKALIDNGKITESKIICDLLVAKNSLNLTEEKAQKYVDERDSSQKDKNIVIKLHDSEDDFSCDNCGYNFEEGETYCGQCGTMRKDLRRRV